MAAEEEKKELAEEKKNLAAKNSSKKGESRSYYLVVIMLGILGVLVFLLLIMPSWSPTKDAKDLMDYYKWAFAVLLGAFGAWIGAGAAYFFGKENLQESSRSTESALRIQQELFQRPPLTERIKDMALTAMNPNFIFSFDASPSYVRKKLADFKGYWFVPVVTKDTGILEDIIHAQVFWNPEFAKEAKDLKEFVSKMDEVASSKKLHGDLFYVKVTLNDKISDVYDLISRRDAEVAIVVDEKGKPSHCLSKTDLRNLLKA